MTQTAFPMNNKKYYAEDVQLFHIGRKAGIFNLEGLPNLRVEMNTGFTVKVRPGYAFILTGLGHVGGVCYQNSEDEILELARPDTTDRYDYIALRYIKSSATCSLFAIKGSNVKPTPVRTDDIYEIILATVLVRGNADSILAVDITDTRLDSKLCGLVVDTCASIPTDALNAQFMAWFDDVKGKLDGDTAGNLSNRLAKVEARPVFNWQVGTEEPTWETCPNGCFYFQLESRV